MLREDKGEYTGFKEEIGPNLWVIGAVMEAICRGRGSGSLGRDRSFGIGYELATICFKLASDWPRFLPRSGHDRAMIGSRSGVDRGTGE